MNDVDILLDIERLGLASSVFDVVICNHVLEHVDDRKSFQELYRVVKPRGLAIVTVPIIEGWTKTYENSSIASEHERELHFGRRDHIRYYGSDFRDRARAGGFSIQEFGASGQEVVQYALIRGEKIFVLRRPA